MDRFEFSEAIADEVRLPMIEWLQQHGIDANEVCTPGWIERDVAGRRVRYLAYNMAYFGRHESAYGEHDDVSMHEVRVVQLEAEPLSFPPVAK